MRKQEKAIKRKSSHQNIPHKIDMNQKENRPFKQLKKAISVTYVPFSLEFDRSTVPAMAEIKESGIALDDFIS